MEIPHLFLNQVLVISPNKKSFYTHEGPLFTKHSLELIERYKAHKVIINLRQLSSIDSSGLFILLHLLKQVKKKGGIIKLSNVESEVRIILEIVRLHKLFEIYPSHEDAIRAFRYE